MPAVMAVLQRLDKGTSEMAARKTSYIRWGVTGECGLYVGQWLTRADAIAEHASRGRRRDEPEVPDRAYGGKLSTAQLEIWKRQQTRGDRAVKLKISFL